jgi:hypothetical protein
MTLTWTRVCLKRQITHRRSQSSKRKLLLIGKPPSNRIVIWRMFQTLKKLIIIRSRKGQKRYLRRESAKDVRAMLLIAVQPVLACPLGAAVGSAVFL